MIHAVRIALLVGCAAFFSACLAPSDQDAGNEQDAGLHDAGTSDGGQCTADGTSCWASETICELGTCTYQFDAGGLCGTVAISPSCRCALDSSGYHPQCTGGCRPAPDGGFERVCVNPNCGQVSCGAGTRCVAYSHCE